MASSSTVDKPRPPKPPGGEWVEYDEFIDRQIRKTRGQVKSVEIASALMTLAAGALAFFLVAAVLDHWVLPHGLGLWGRWLCLAMFLGGAGYYAAEKLLPWLIYRINPIYAAQTIEKSRPTLKNSLINFLFLRGQSAPMSPAVYKAVEEQAAAGLSRVAVESAVDRSRLIHIGYALLAIVGLFAAYILFSPKNPWNTIGRVMLPWSDIAASTRVEILDVQPGSRTVYRGEPVEVSAEIRGLKNDEPVRVVYSTADHESVDQPVTMYLPPDRFRHSARIPADAASDGPGAGQPTAGVQQDIDYRIEAGDTVSPTYHLTAVTAPTIVLDSVDYQYPAYTGRPRVTLKGIGDIQSLEGTRVVIHGRANQTIKSAQLELDGRAGRTKLPMQIGSDGRTVTGSFTLALDEQDRTSPQFSHYRLRPEGRAEPEPVQYRIDVIPDLPPEVKFILPEKDEVALPVNGRLKLKLRALDPDFALSEVTLSAESNRATILEQRLLNEIRREPMQVDYVIDPAKLHLKVDDVVEYWATAKDNRAPTPNATLTSRRRIRIVAADARQGSAGENQSDANGEAKPGEKSDKANPSDKSNDKKPGTDAANQDQPQAERKPGDNSPPGKSSEEQKPDKQEGPDNRPPDAKHDQPQDKPSAEQQKPGQEGSAKQQDPSQQQSGNNQNSADKQDADKNQGKNQGSDKQQSGDKQQKGGGSSNSQQNGGQSSQKSDAGKDGSDSKSGNQNSGDKSGGDKSKSSKSIDSSEKNNDGSQQDNGGQQASKSTADKQKAADSSEQRDERVAPDGSDLPEAIKQILKHRHDENAKNADQSRNSDSQKSSGDEKQSGGDKLSNSKNLPDSQPKPGDKDSSRVPQQKPGDKSSDSANAKKPSDGQKPSDAQKSADGQKPADGQKSGEKSAGDKAASGDKTAGSKSATDKPKADKPSGDQQSTKEGDDRSSADKKNGENHSAADKSNGANSTKEQAPTDKNPPDKGSADKSGGSKSADKAEKPDAQPPRDSDPGLNKTGSGEKPDQGKGQRTKDGSQPTGDKSEAKENKEQSKTNGGDPDSNKGKSGAGGDTEKNDQATPPAPQAANQPSKSEKEQPASAMKKEMQAKDEGKSPTASPKESNSKGGQDGSLSGGGKKGGGQGANNPGTGGPGKNTSAEQGTGVSEGHGQGEDSQKAGADKAADHKTGESGNEKGNGSHIRSAESNSANNPASDQSQDAGKQIAPSPQGSASKNSNNPTGPGGSSYESRGGGGGSGDPTGPPPAAHGSGDPANAEFAKKQFDMALESLKKGKPDLLKELNWTPEEARQLAERLERMRRNAEVPGAKGDDARRQMDDLLHSLGARGGQVDRRSGGNAIDAQRGLHESHDAGPPPEYSEQFGAFQQGILQGGK